MNKEFWGFLGVVGAFLLLIMAIIGIIHMVTKDFFEGFVIMTLSLILSILIRLENEKRI